MNKVYKTVWNKRHFVSRISEQSRGHSKQSVLIPSQTCRSTKKLVWFCLTILIKFSPTSIICMGKYLFRQQFERFIAGRSPKDFVEGFDLEFDCHIVLFLGRRLARKPSNVSQLLLTLSNFTPKQKNQLKLAWKG